MLQNSENYYGWVAIILHWLSALWLIALFMLGLWMVELDYYSQWYNQAPHYHKSLGLLLSLLILCRLLWSFVQASPAPLQSGWQKRLAKYTHHLLYVLIFAILISGYLISTALGHGIELFNWFTVPALPPMMTNQESFAGDWHRWLAYSMIALSIIHALAALKHHFINKDTTLVRMLKPTPLNKEQL